MKREIKKCKWCGETYIRSAFPYLEPLPPETPAYRASRFRDFCSQECHDRKELFESCSWIEIYGEKDNL